MSISPSEIRRDAARINDLTGDVQRISREVQAHYHLAGEYWTGTASSALQAQYQALDIEMRALLRSLKQLESGVQGVASEVQRADQERAEKKRQAERLAAEKERERRGNGKRAPGTVKEQPVNPYVSPVNPCGKHLKGGENNGR